VLRGGDRGRGEWGNRHLSPKLLLSSARARRTTAKHVVGALSTLRARPLSLVVARARPPAHTNIPRALSSPFSSLRGMNQRTLELP
jgi:hypothetical protein